MLFGQELYVSSRRISYKAEGSDSSSEGKRVAETSDEILEAILGPALEYVGHR